MTKDKIYALGSKLLFIMAIIIIWLNVPTDLSVAIIACLVGHIFLENLRQNFEG